MTINLSALQKQRRDTAANWTAENPTLLAGEIGLESDTGYWKVGDGATAWTSLAYVSGLGAEIPVDRLADGAARQLLQTDAAGTGVEWTDDIDVPGALDVTGAATFDDDVTIQGDLTVNGTTTTIDTTTLVVEDKNIEIGKVATPTDVTADGGGITLKGSTDKTINWVDATDAWTLSEHVDIASAKEYRIAGTKVLDATSLGSAVVSSSLTSVGTIGTGVWEGTAIDATYLDSSVVTTGDTGTVTSTMIADGTIVDGDVNASAAIAGTKIDPDFGSQTVETTGVFSAAAGAAATPSIAFTGDLNTGIYSPGADQVAISTNGAQRLLIEADGDINIDSGGVFYDATNNRLAIGTTSPGSLLTLDGTSSTSLGRASTYIHVGGADFGSGSYRLVSFGYALSAEEPPAFIGYVETNPSSSTNGALIFGTRSVITNTAPTERARIDSSGRLLVGTSSASSTATTLLLQGSASSSSGGSYLRLAAGTATPANGSTIGQVSFTDSGHSTAASIVGIRDGGTWTSGSSHPTRIIFTTTADGAGSPTERMRIDSNGAVEIFDNIRPRTDNTTSLGTASKRWSVVYAATGSINTSDETLKQDIEELNAAELSVATAIKGLIKKFRFTDAVSNKGDDARIHVGVIAQEVEQAFVAAGLDPRRYGMFCEDTLEDGTKRLGIRYDELLAFVIAAL